MTPQLLVLRKLTDFSRKAFRGEEVVGFGVLGKMNLWPQWPCRDVRRD